MRSTVARSAASLQIVITHGSDRGCNKVVPDDRARPEVGLLRD